MATPDPLALELERKINAQIDEAWTNGDHTVTLNTADIITHLWNVHDAIARLGDSIDGVL